LPLPESADDGSVFVAAHSRGVKQPWGGGDLGRRGAMVVPGT